MQLGHLQKGYQACARKEVLNDYGSILEMSIIWKQ